MATRIGFYWACCEERLDEPGCTSRLHKSVENTPARKNRPAVPIVDDIAVNERSEASSESDSEMPEEADDEDLEEMVSSQDVEGKPVKVLSIKEKVSSLIMQMVAMEKDVLGTETKEVSKALSIKEELAVL